MASVITLSGWGQPVDALSSIFPEASCLDYGAFDDIEAFYQSVSGKECDILVGWSLGGQLALRLLSAGHITARHLVLLATPFQFVSSDDIVVGVDQGTIFGFKELLRSNPEGAFRRFNALVARNDADEKVIRRQLKTEQLPAGQWLYWLEQLEKFSCHQINFEKIPTTLVIHGVQDALVDINQTGLFYSVIKHCRVHTMDHCSHAPHLHDLAEVKEVISHYVHA